MPPTRSIASGTSTGSEAAEEQSLAATKDTFILTHKAKFLLIVFSIASFVVVAGGIVRNSVFMVELDSKLYKLRQAEKRIQLFEVVDQMSESVVRQSMARAKYLTSGYDAVAFTEMNEKSDQLEELFDNNREEFQEIYFSVPEYRRYNCSFSFIRSSLQTRPEAVPLNQYQTYDERQINPWHDVHYFDCLLSLLVDLQAQLLYSSVGFEDMWQMAVAYYMTWRSELNFEVAIIFAHVTRETVLNKGLFHYPSVKDGAQLDEAVVLAESFIIRASQLTGDSVNDGSSALAVDTLVDLIHLTSHIENATEALLIVSRDEFDTTAMATRLLNQLVMTKKEYMSLLETGIEDMIENQYFSMISDGVKLLIFIFIIPPILAKLLYHTYLEKNRLLDRYDQSVYRYLDSCKAIFRLLPEPVVRKLNAGKNVPPEYFCNATVLFSDIVGFTTICSKLTANDVLTMLNTVYTTFDRLTKSQRCYKIETIGDAYVVASGVPNRHDSHCSEIASLGLLLTEEVSLIKIGTTNRHIRIRVGINSGPVIACIVGVKMLRYCLFGKTVIEANRMESESMPAQKILLSYSSHLELNRVGGFRMEERNPEFWPHPDEPSFFLLGKNTNSMILSLFGSVDANSQTACIEL